MKRLTVCNFIILVLVGVFLMSGGSSYAQSQKDLKLGFIAPLSGPAAPWGITWQRGALRAIEDINKSGGIKVKGETFILKLISEDDRYDPALTTTAAHRLIEEHGCKFIHGSITSPGAIATSAVSEPAKVIIFVGGSSPKRLGPDKPFTFCIHMGGAETAPMTYEWAAKNYSNVKRIASVQPNDEVGQAYNTMLVPLFPGVGWTNAGVELYERGTKDFYPLISKILPKKPDIIDLSLLGGGDVGLIAKQARELGFKGLFLASAALDFDTLLKIAKPEALEGFISNAMKIPGPYIKPEEEKFYKSYMEKYGPPWQELVISSYVTTMMLKKAIEQTGTVTDTAAVRDAMVKMKFESELLGMHSFGGQKMYGIQRSMQYDFFVSLFKGGKLETVARIKGVVP